MGRRQYTEDGRLLSETIYECGVETRCARDDGTGRMRVEFELSPDSTAYERLKQRRRDGHGRR